jgi:putative ABC transport system permease protein
VLAAREMLRRKFQFGLISLIVGLIIFLIIMIAALGTGLMAAMSGAVDAWDTDLLVYSETSNESILRSELTDDDIARIAAAPGVASVARAGYLPVTAEDEDGGLTDATLFGIDPQALGPGTKALGPGELVADASFLRESGLRVGDRMFLRNALRRYEFTIVAGADQGQFLGLPTVYSSVEDWRRIRYPGDDAAPAASIALVWTAGGQRAAAEEALDADPGLSALSKGDAILAIGGVRQQTQVVRTIELFGFVIGALVIGMFFYVLTMQKTGQIAIFKAMGASNTYVLRQLVQQVVAVVAVGAAIGVPLALITDALIPERIPVDITGTGIALAAVGVLATGLLGTVFSGRHVALVDPMTALGQAQ